MTGDHAHGAHPHPHHGHAFDRAYWDEVWSAGEKGAMASTPPNPHLVTEIDGLAPGSALEAGCGAGTEALWLATRGWQVTGVDLSGEALDIAARRADREGLSSRATWIEADLSVWEPSARFDLVTTHYAHPAIPQLAFYERLAGWVAPGGTLLVVGHLHGRGHGHGHRPPAEASATAAAVEDLLDPAGWEVLTSWEGSRVVKAPGGRESTISDVVVRAVRRPVGPD